MANLPYTLRRGFDPIFWGLLCLLVDIDLGPIPLVPDFVGYWMIAVGAGRLARLHVLFSRAQILATVLVAVSFLTMVVPGGITPAVMLFFLAAPVMALDVLLIWWLCTGVADLAARSGRGNVKAQATRRRNAYAGLVAGSYVFWVFVVVSDSWRLMVLPMLVLAVLSIVMTVLLMNLMRRARDLRPDPQALPSG